MPISHTKALGFELKSILGGNRLLAQVIESLMPKWETWIEFLVLSFNLAQACLLQVSGE